MSVSFCDKVKQFFRDLSVSESCISSCCNTTIEKKGHHHHHKHHNKKFDGVINNEVCKKCGAKHCNCNK